jgi:hypothetical protein
MQTYAGTASRSTSTAWCATTTCASDPWQGEIQVQLTRQARARPRSHDIAVEARELLTPMAARLGARIAVVEMPPGPPVLQSVVAEVYGPDAETRRQVAADLTEMFEQVDGLADVDNYMSRALRGLLALRGRCREGLAKGVSVDTIIQNLAMAMGGHKITATSSAAAAGADLDRASRCRWRCAPISTALGRPAGPRSDDGSHAAAGRARPLRAHRRKTRSSITRTCGRWSTWSAMPSALGAPIYPMLKIDEKLLGLPDAGRRHQVMSGTYDRRRRTTAVRLRVDRRVDRHLRDLPRHGCSPSWRRAGADLHAGRLGVRQLPRPGVIMAPIPLTLLGIVPGHWLLGADFTATSMIGFIALAGIIVRNSILLVDFAVEEVRKGIDVARP